GQQSRSPFSDESLQDSSRLNSSISLIHRMADRIMEEPRRLKLPIERRRSFSNRSMSTAS
ncbi:unnamed protein product, partial [Amoebophrya sp. A25]